MYTLIGLNKVCMYVCNLLNEVDSFFGILKYVCDIVVKKVHIRYLIS